jgi:hypothetical protein
MLFAYENILRLSVSFSILFQGKWLKRMILFFQFFLFENLHEMLPLKIGVLFSTLFT